MVTLIGIVASVAVGLGAAAGGSLILINTSDPDTTQQVQVKFKDQYNPLKNADTIYGSR
ncbi:hypothetical protein [Actinocrispum sp. NPDC049592]|uniref:hypothetical protein n=1 Tax=Actinocrispum sp. NPDC049592 TaxID=3154835 RepID=UPI00341682DF